MARKTGKGDVATVFSKDALIRDIVCALTAAN